MVRVRATVSILEESVLGKRVFVGSRGCRRDGQQKSEHARFPDAGLSHEGHPLSAVLEAGLENPSRDYVAVLGGLLGEP